MHQLVDVLRQLQPNVDGLPSGRRVDTVRRQQRAQRTVQKRHPRSGAGCRMLVDDRRKCTGSARSANRTQTADGMSIHSVLDEFLGKETESHKDNSNF